MLHYIKLALTQYLLFTMLVLALPYSLLIWYLLPESWQVPMCLIYAFAWGFEFLSMLSREEVN